MLREGLSIIVALAAWPALADQAPAEIALRARGDGWVLTDARGMSLYTFANDYEPGKSACKDECPKQWPPLAAPDDAKASGEWSAIDRAEGARQWAFRGQPLYAYSGDVSPGDSYGDDLARLWHVAFKPMMTPAEFKVIRSDLGQVLADATRNLTVYVSDRDTPGASACDAACAKTWIPVVAPGAANPKGDWSIVTRADGGRQWAYQGRALYRHAGDAKPGGARGAGADKAWHAVVLEPPPPMPAWVRIHQSDAGELLTDAGGKTLYQYVQPRRRPRVQAIQSLVNQGNPVAPETNEAGVEQDLPPEPVPKIFTPVTVQTSGEAKAVGNWRIVKHDGVDQWAYKGLPLFTNIYDTAPGDLKGSRGGDRRFHTIMRNGEQMQGTGQ